MRRKIYLHGRLSEKFGKVFELEVQTAGEAVRAMCANFPEFTAELKEGSYELVRGHINEKTGHWLELDQVNSFRLGKADFHIVPHIAGSKNNRAAGSTKIILGVALLGAALFLGPVVGIGWLSAGMAGNLAMVGLALTVAGVARLLTPAQQNPYQQASFSLSGPTNVYDQGNPVPLVYGRCMCGSQLISAAIDVEPIPVNWDPTQGNTLIDTVDPETGQGIFYGPAGDYTQPAGNTIQPST